MAEFLSYLLRSVTGSYLHVLPLVVLTVPLGEWLKRSGLAQKWVPAMRARPLIAVLVAAAAGAVSPLCSCGVIPVIAGLLRAGTPLGPVMAFWIASPSMDPEIFALSAAYLGLPLATARLVATALASVGAGLAAHFLERAGLFGTNYLRGAALAHQPAAEPKARFTPRGAFSALSLRPAAACACGGADSAPLSPSQSAMARAGSDCACGGAPSAQFAPPAGPAAYASAAGSPLTYASAAAAPAGASCACGGETRTAGKGIAAKALDILRDSAPEFLRISGAMLIAFVLEALVKRFVPMGIIAPVLGAKSAFAIPLATAIGVPMYTTNLTALGVVSGLLAKGMSQGAALAFLIGGAATTVPAMAAVWSLVKPRVFAFYLGVIIAAALASGYLWEIIALR